MANVFWQFSFSNFLGMQGNIFNPGCFSLTMTSFRNLSFVFARLRRKSTVFEKHGV